MRDPQRPATAVDGLPDCPSRRGVLRSLAGIGVSTIAAGVLVGCSTDNSRVLSPSTTGDAATGSAGAAGSTTDGAGAAGTGSTHSTDGTDPTGSTDGADGADSSDASDGTAAGDAAAEASVPLADVPVGQAVVVDALGSRFVVAQPTAGEVVAFSASCTHAGTPVEAVGGLELRCPNHGSRFDAGDGAAVLNGPAAQPLPSVRARIEGDLVVLSA